MQTVLTHQNTAVFPTHMAVQRSSKGTMVTSVWLVEQGLQGPSREGWEEEMRGRVEEFLQSIVRVNDQAGMGRFKMGS